MSSHGKGHGAKIEEEHHEGAPEWLISFADNVALMMGFFVILLAMNMKPVNDSIGGSPYEHDNPPTTTPSAQMLDWAIALREAFNNPIDPESPSDALLAARLVEREREGKAVQRGPRGQHEAVNTLRPTDYYGLAGLVHFRARSNALDEAGRTQVRQIAEHVRGLRSIVEVRGHCSAAEAADSNDRGMRFSGERAFAVAQELVAQGVGWELLHVIACGRNDRASERDYDRFASEANQRVEVVVTSNTLEEP
ncbi:MAG: OmpA family protein [Phycisphaerae bacterium]|jgi:outer membrane protein OmpA-like peptidoglycan-associated protein|nr:OmpA family protein [Phycisphaerae bacterium]MCZ2400418.1 OmpA family protein [Phycisphaerae bacterium]